MHHLFIVNKAGSLLFSSDFSGARLNANEKIIIASMFHGFVESFPVRSYLRLSAIGGKLSPAGDRSGIHVLDTDTFRLQSFRSPTG